MGGIVGMVMVGIGGTVIVDGTVQVGGAEVDTLGITTVG